MQEKPPILKLSDGAETGFLPGVNDEERRKLQIRIIEWTSTLAPDGDAVSRDMVRLAARSYAKIERIHDCDDAETERRVRNADVLWKREQAREVKELIAKLEHDSFIAVVGLESSVEGIEWMIATFEGLIASIEAGQWSRESHELFRKLLRHDAGDPKGHRRVPDLWFEKIYRYEQVLKYCNQPIAELPWEERVITAKKLNDAYKHDEELLERLRQEAIPYDIAYTELAKAQIKRLTELRERLLPYEDIDREQAKMRALYEDTPASRARHNCLVDTERTLSGFVKDLRAQIKTKAKQQDEAEAADQPSKPRSTRGKGAAKTGPPHDEDG